MKYAIEIGIRNSSLKPVADTAAEFFGIPVQERYSDYMGGDYYLIRGEREEARLQLNRDCDEVAEEEHPDVNVLVIVDPTERPEEVQEFFAERFDCVVIRKEIYPAKERDRKNSGGGQ